MSERKNGSQTEWDLVSMHPFTAQQAEIIRLKAQGLSEKQIANKLYITRETVRNHVCGSKSNRNPENLTASDKGILGVIEEATGLRPRNNWMGLLVGDVLFPFESKSENGE